MKKVSSSNVGLEGYNPIILIYLFTDLPSLNKKRQKDKFCQQCASFVENRCMAIIHSFERLQEISAEGVSQRHSIVKIVLKILKYSQKSTCAGVCHCRLENIVLLKFKLFFCFWIFFIFCISTSMIVQLISYPNSQLT